MGMKADPIMPKACSIPCLWRTFTKASSVVIFIEIILLNLYQLLILVSHSESLNLIYSIIWNFCQGYYGSNSDRNLIVFDSFPLAFGKAHEIPSTLIFVDICKYTFHWLAFSVLFLRKHWFNYIFLSKFMTDSNSGEAEEKPSLIQQFPLFYR